MEVRRHLVAVVRAQDPDHAAQDDEAGADERGCIHSTKRTPSETVEIAHKDTPGPTLTPAGCANGDRPGGQDWNSSSRYFGSGQRSSATIVSSSSTTVRRWACAGMTSDAK